MKAAIGAGSFIGRDVRIGARTAIGAAVLVHQGCDVGSDYVIETLCVLANGRAGADRAELVAASVGSLSLLGPRGIIHAGIRVGGGVRTAEGAVVTSDVPDGSVRHSQSEPR